VGFQTGKSQTCQTCEMPQDMYGHLRCQEALPGLSGVVPTVVTLKWRAGGLDRRARGDGGPLPSMNRKLHCQPNTWHNA